MIVRSTDARRLDVPEVAADLATADFVALGELHGTPEVHTTHLAILEAMYLRRRDMVIAMEMFERDVQNVMLKYLAGVIDEATFLAEARPPRDYARDYRPVVEFAKAHGIVVLAANAPRPLAAKVAKEGLASVAGDQLVARTTTAPEDEYWDAFRAAMASHPGENGPAALKRSYVAQCLKDDTMAESIVDYLQQHRTDPMPLAVLICGRMHSDHRRGTVARVLSRMPDLRVRTLSAEFADTADPGIISAPRSVADYVVLAHPVPMPQRVEEPDLPPTPAVAAPTPPPAPKAAPGGAAADPDARPALGFKPDYAASEGGVLVEGVSEGGPAEAAGMQAGDLVVEVGGQPVADIHAYVAALDTLTIGEKTSVKVKRDGKVIDLAVTVTSRVR